jgi:RNA polymerase sigma-70 factor (ECF subfamily)
MTTSLTPDPDSGGTADPLEPLVRAAADGQREALVRLLSAIAPAVTATVRVLLGARHPDLDDAVQETLLAITAAMGRFRGESSFLHYARRIAVRTALALRRASTRGEQGLAALAAAEPRGERWRAEPSPLEREQRVALFVKLLDELPEGQAECLAYRVLLELPLPRIADELGVPMNTVRSRVRLARTHLRDRIMGDPALAAALREDEP